MLQQNKTLKHILNGSQSVLHFRVECVVKIETYISTVFSFSRSVQFRRLAKLLSSRNRDKFNVNLIFVCNKRRVHRNNSQFICDSFRRPLLLVCIVYFNKPLYFLLNLLFFPLGSLNKFLHCRDYITFRDPSMMNWKGYGRYRPGWTEVNHGEHQSGYTVSS